MPIKSILDLVHIKLMMNIEFNEPGEIGSAVVSLTQSAVSLASINDYRSYIARVHMEDAQANTDNKAFRPMMDARLNKQEHILADASGGDTARPHLITTDFILPVDP